MEQGRGREKGRRERVQKEGKTRKGMRKWREVEVWLEGGCMRWKKMRIGDGDIIGAGGEKGNEKGKERLNESGDGTCDGGIER